LAQGQQSLAAAQRALVLLKRAIVALLIVTVAALVGAVLLAHRRRRMAIVLVLSTAVVMLVVRALTKHVAEAAPSLAVQPGARAAIQSVVDALVAGLFALVEVTLLVSLVVAVVVWLTGNGRRAASLRGRAGTGSDGVLAFATDHREATAVVSFGLAALLVTVGGLSAVPLVLALVAVAMGVWALAFAAR
jgi:hypothetical protein